MDQDLDFSRAQLTLAEQIQIGERSSANVRDILQVLAPLLTDERRSRLEQVVAGRSLKLVPILENIYDRGNVSAVMRSAEAFGYLKMVLLDRPGVKFKAANRVTRGAEKWLDVHMKQSASLTVEELKGQGYQVWATDLNTNHTIEDLPWEKPLAIVMGNEKDGVSQELLNLVDGRFKVPMLGFSQSFNISVAAALIFYRAHLEHRKQSDQGLLTESERRQVLANYYLRCFDNPEQILLSKRVLLDRLLVLSSHSS